MKREVILGKIRRIMILDVSEVQGIHRSEMDLEHRGYQMAD